jgi:hypothetical protein
MIRSRIARGSGGSPGLDDTTIGPTMYVAADPNIATAEQKPVCEHATAMTLHNLQTHVKRSRFFNAYDYSENLRDPVAGYAQVRGE